MAQATRKKAPAQWTDPRWQRRMRDTEPVWHDRDGHLWHVFRYADVAEVLSDHQRFGSNFAAALGEHADLAEGNIVAMDPPRHHRLRRLVSRAFTPRAIAALEDRITDLTHELLDRVADPTRMELVADLAYPLPVTVIAELLGVPAQDRDRFKVWADDLLSSENIDPTDTAALDTQRARLAKFHDYLGEHVALRRRAPRTDLLTDLVAAEIDGERLGDREIVGFATTLLIAGHITTTVLLGNVVRCLDENPGVAGRLRAEPELIPAAIEEVLRYRSPFARPARVTTADTPLAGRVIPAGAMVMAWLDSANHDEREFPDPDTFVADRTPNPHLGFGKGIHFCLGAPLARLEARVALGILLDRFADLAVDPDRPLVPYRNPGINGTSVLHLRLRPA